MKGTVAMAAALRCTLPSSDKHRPTGEVDQGALMLMLAYVEAECLRLGAADSAHHAAMAAALLPGPVLRPGIPRAKMS